jgi:hypothetical protein
LELSGKAEVAASSDGVEVVAAIATGGRQIDVITREVIKMALEEAVERIRSALLTAHTD